MPATESPANVHLRTVAPTSCAVGHMEDLRVLLVQHCANRTGSTISGLLVARGFRNAGWPVDVAFGFDGPMISEYEKLGCRAHVAAHKNWLRGGNVVQSARRIAAEKRNAGRFRQLIADVQPDVVYVNTLVSLAAANAARRMRVPCVWHIRELFDDVGGEMRVPAFGGRRLVRRMLKNLASRRVAISRSVAENILGTIDPGLIEIVPNAVDNEFFEVADDTSACRRQFELPSSGPVIGVPGTLRPMKGHPFLLQAASHVVRDVPECVFAITGTGEPQYESEIKAQVARLGLENNVRLLGTVTDMPRFYRACDIACVPSVAEPFGRTVIEAFAVGTPVVATAVGGMRETIQDGETGMLVEYGNVDQLRGALCNLLGDAALRQRFSENGRRSAQEQYTAAAYEARLVDIVRAAVQAADSRNLK